MIKYNPKQYFFKGNTLKWGKNLTPKQMKALRQGEVFILLAESGKPHKRILMDFYNQIRESPVESQCKLDIAIKGLTI